MTQDEIIEMARQAGGMFSELPMMDAWVFGDKSLEAFAKLVAQHEREACAKVCDRYVDSSSDHEAGTAMNLQDAIRARGQA